MGLTGLIFGIPVFFDVGIFVLAPIVYAAAKRTGKSILLYCHAAARGPVDDPRLPARRTPARSPPPVCSTWTSAGSS